MFKQIAFHGTLNERTGYGIHASRFVEQLSKIVPVNLNGEGDVHLSLLDVVTASCVLNHPPNPSILYTAWESTEYPEAFMQKFHKYAQFWTPSEWQRSCSIAQGVPEEIIKVVPEGVDPEVYKPGNVLVSADPNGAFFNFIHVGQWQPRKSTKEIIETFLKTFPGHLYPKVRLFLLADTLFPSDKYQSTEERLLAYSFVDSRIIPVHFNDRDGYVKYLQSSHCFVSCSRAEGWGLPIIEAMACGTPTIVCDYSGSTEYAGRALKVRIKEMIKPFGIYGDWDVPGQWCEPDFNHLSEVMLDAYQNYAKHKEDALATSEYIRTEFSWKRAAEKAAAILEELQLKITSISTKEPDLTPSLLSPENDIKAYASRLGYEVSGIKKRSAIFAVDCWPSSEEKMKTLIETIEQIHSLGYPVLISSHYPLPAPIIELADYYLYEQRDIMSGDDKPIYWRRRPDGREETKKASVEYQGVAAINCFRNSIDFCRGRFDWVYQMGSDMEVDLAEWLRLVQASTKPMICIPYEGKKDGIGGGLWAGRTEVLDKVIPRLDSWKQYAEMFPDLRFIAEKWLCAYLKSIGYDTEAGIDWISIHTENRFDNVDRDIWPDDDFHLSFVDGPTLSISGLSRREYDVVFSEAGTPLYATKLKVGMFSKPSVKYYKDWEVSAYLEGERKFHHKFDPAGRNILISMGSKALGDTIAWMPYLEEFRKKWNCNLYCSGWWQEIFDYPEIKFVKPGTSLENIYASFTVGCFDTQLDKNVTDWRLTPLQKIAPDILGLDYVPLRAKLKRGGNGHTIMEPYVCFSEFSTMRGKLWNRPNAWQNVVDYLNSLGYKCVSVSSEKSGLSNIISHNGQGIQSTIDDISHCAFYLGLNHGPSWIAYALNIPSIMITGMSEPWNDAPNPYRISIDVCRPGCFNDPSLPMERGWEWCPRGRDFSCTREITEDMVISQIDRIHARMPWNQPFSHEIRLEA